MFGGLYLRLVRKTEQRRHGNMENRASSPEKDGKAWGTGSGLRFFRVFFYSNWGGTLRSTDRGGQLDL